MDRKLHRLRQYIGLGITIAATIGCSQSTTPTTNIRDDGWEVIAPDYSNIRGLNYIFDYPTLAIDPPIVEGPHPYIGVVSSVAQWRFYGNQTRHHVREQLAQIKSLGCNAVRVWLSHPAWEHERELFINKLVDFMQMAEAARIYVMPIIFDHVFREPTPGAQYHDIHDWKRNPSLAEMELEHEFHTRPGGGREYVINVVTAIKDSPALLMWDIMNEPPARLPMLGPYLELVKQLDPETPTTVGFAAVADSGPGTAYYNSYVDDPHMDVISFHPYGIFHENYALALQRVQNANLARNTNPKPVLSTEGGYPTGFQRYQDHIQYIVEEGERRGSQAGFFVFQALIAHHEASFPYHKETGIFFYDGTVRDLAGAQAFRAEAIRQGISGLPELVAMDRNSPEFVPYVFEPVAASDVPYILNNWLQWRTPMSFSTILGEGYNRQLTLLRWVAISLAYLSHYPEGYGGILTAADLDRILALGAELGRFNLMDPNQTDFLTQQGWITQGINGLEVQWSRWDELFSTTAAEFGNMMQRYGIGGPISQRRPNADG